MRNDSKNASTSANTNKRRATPARVILRGELDQVSLPSLLTLMDMEQRMGVLIIERERALARLHIRDGQIVRARVEGTERCVGEHAVYEVLAWPSGQFELWQVEVTGRDEIGKNTRFLLMEGMRRIDEQQAEATRLPAKKAEAKSVASDREPMGVAKSIDEALDSGAFFIG